MNETIAVACPYCGEKFYIEPEPSDDLIEYIEDCHICCQPVLLTVKFSFEGSQVKAKRENE